VTLDLKRNRRSLHSATPEFLWKLVALANIMRLSLEKGAHVAVSSAAWQEIRDNGKATEWVRMVRRRKITPKRIMRLSRGRLIPRPCQVDPGQWLPAIRDRRRGEIDHHPALLAAALRDTPQDWQHKNLQLVIRFNV
jgi:hypothetical protein